MAIGLLGGDTDRRSGVPLSVTVMALGTVPAGRMVRRSAAQPGDFVYVSGTLGDAALGLRLHRGEPGSGAEGDGWLVARYLRPQPRTGLRDALLAHARELCPDPDHAALDLLWSTGELRSVALLALALHALGVRAVGVNVHQTGIVADGRAAAFRFRPLRLRAVLDSTDVVVAPGFLARLAGDAVASLGRGGSDLTAVLLAAGLRARRCELIKDVPGYFSADPNLHRDATHLPAVSWDEALRLAEGGCELVQAAAIQEARTHALPLVVRGLGGDGRTTVVGDGRRLDAELAVLRKRLAHTA